MKHPPVLVEQLGDTHRAEYFEHYHGDRLAGVYVDVWVGARLDSWFRARGPYKSLVTARRAVKQAMRGVAGFARAVAGASLQ